MITTAAVGALLTAALLGVARTPLVPDESATTQAGGSYCVIIRDGEGRPVNTTCIPWPF